MKKMISALLCVALPVGLAGCSTPAMVAQQDQAAEGEGSAASMQGDGIDLTFTDRDKDPGYDEASATRITLNGDVVTVGGAGATAEGPVVTISADGAYLVSGSLDNGLIVVDLPGEDDKAQIVLDGVTIHNDTGPALYVRQADKVFVTLAEGSTNVLSDGAEYASTDDGNDPKAALYSKDDLVINGTGSLKVAGSHYHGIASTNDLKVTGGRIAVSCVQDAFHGKDCIKIAGGDITVNAGDDAFHSEYLFYLEAGTVNVESCVEGYEAEKVIVAGGESTIVASDDGVNASAAEEEGSAADGSGQQSDGAEGAQPPALPQGAEDAPRSLDGAQPPERVGEGDGRGERFERDDASFDGEPPESLQNGMTAGNGRPGEGIENGIGRSDGQPPEPPDGERPQESRDMGGRTVMPGASEDCLIRIDGGVLRVDAGGDGLDSNGSIEINGGTVLVSGASDGDDTGLDYELEAVVNGGELIAVGSASLAKDLTGGAQAHLMERLSGEAGSTVEVLNASGEMIVSYTVPKAFQMVNASVSDQASIVVR